MNSSAYHDIRYTTTTLAAVLAVVGTFVGSSRANGILSSADLVNVFNAAAARPGIAIGGVHYDVASDTLFLIGGSDGGTPNSNFYRFTTSGSLLYETATGAVGGNSLAGLPGSSYLVMSQTSTTSGVQTVNQLLVSFDGTLQSSTAVPGVVSFAGLAVHPTTGNFWGAESAGATDNLYELDSNFNVLQVINYSSLISGNILGLDIDPATGNFLATVHGNNTEVNEVVEFDADVTSILSTLSLDDPNWYSLTSVTIGGTGPDRRLFVSSGVSDRIFEFSVPTPQAEVPEPASLAAWGLLALTGTACLILRSRRKHASRQRT